MANKPAPQAGCQCGNALHMFKGRFDVIAVTAQVTWRQKL